ncbi:MAG: hypothetical protein BAJATHORv1_50058 [Candidatus Thorarchaeota archaeon]|nr:MAG: hypothetical protein BAJATHORv1_50058 [Candidatus Thorarchaeota archaeon]
MDMIRVVSPPHCKKGPARCSGCREAAQTKKICHIHVYTTESEEFRPLIQMEIRGIPGFYEYEIIEVFESPNEAIEYARENSIDDIDLSMGR